MRELCLSEPQAHSTMKSPAKCLVGFAIGIAGLSVAALIARHATDDNLSPFFPAAAVVCVAYWFGGALFADGWQTSIDGLGKRLIDQLKYDTGSIIDFIYPFFVALLAIVRLAIEHNGIPPLHEVLLRVLVLWPALGFFVLANPYRRLKIPYAGFAIHEHGVYTVGKSILFEEILSIDCPATPAQAFRIKLPNHIHTMQNAEMDEKELDNVRELLRAFGVLQEEGETESLESVAVA